MLVVPGKSRISHHSLSPAFGSAPFSSVLHSYVRSRGTVAPSVFLFRKCVSLSFTPLISYDSIETVPPAGSVQFRLPAGLLSVLPLRSNRTPRRTRNYGSRRQFQPPRTADTNAPRRFSDIGLSSVTIEPSRERMDCEYVVNGLADRTRLLFTVFARE